MNETWYIIIGAALAIIGGIIGDEFRAWRESRRELKAIKVSIADELSEIETTIGNMHEVWESAKVLSSKYLNELLSNTSMYNNFRPRLFLIKDDGLRRSLSTFYKKLKDSIEKTEGKIGTLEDTDEATAEQARFDITFQGLKTEAEQIREKLLKEYEE